MLQRLGFPGAGPHRRFVSALAIDALGSGIWMPLSMLYFLHQTSLSLIQLGLVMTIANALAIPVGPFLGSLVDRGPGRAVDEPLHRSPRLALAFERSNGPQESACASESSPAAATAPA